MIHRFGEFELDGEHYQLRRAGHALAVQPRVFELLRYLVEARGRVVSREELLAEIWLGVHVAESSLYRAVAVARRLLGDGAGVPDPIELVRGHGYRFAAELSAGAGAAPGMVGPDEPLAALDAARMDYAIRRARATGHPFSLLLALCYAAGFHLARGARADAAACAAEAETLASEQHFALHAAVARLVRAAGLREPRPRLDAMPAALGRLLGGGAREHGAGAAGVTGLLASVLAELGSRVEEQFAAQDPARLQRESSRSAEAAATPREALVPFAADRGLPEVREAREGP